MNVFHVIKEINRFDGDLKLRRELKERCIVNDAIINSAHILQYARTVTKQIGLLKAKYQFKICYKEISIQK
jgi:hypothetical protein